MTRTGGIHNDNKPCKDKKRTGLQGWIDRNRRIIEITIILALFITGNYGLASVMTLLWVVDTM